MARISSMVEAREAVRRIPRDVLEECDVIELVSGILGRYGSVDFSKMDGLLKTAMADHCNIVFQSTSKK